MKRIATILCILAMACLQAGATVATKKVVDYVQPDGSVIKMVIHGDEFRHWVTTPEGTVLTLGKDRFYRPGGSVPRFAPEGLTISREKAAQARRASASDDHILSLGEHRFLVMLVEFDDLRFSVDEPQQAFWDLLNQPGYSKNGGTGSAFDYFNDNSHGKFIPTFDVVGPITLSGGYAEYGGNNSWGNDKSPEKAFYEAIQLADPDVDFSVYDQDGDGVIDNIFFYYAGHNEAEGGGDNTIWPHQYAFYGYYNMFDGVRPYSYACTSEYRGSYGKTMCGIGTFCHEFSHVLGLPDFYDTDYDTNGQCDPLADFDVMCSGSYNNSGCTPPYYGSLERHMLGWMDVPEEITQKGDYSLEAVTNDKAYMTNTGNPGEYFIFETREKTGWDKYTASGMLVYHVDQSENDVHGRTAKYMWQNTNSINCYADHMCYYIVRAKNFGSVSYFPFPGSGNVKSYQSTAWSGEKLIYTFNNINYSDGVTTFNVSMDNAKFVTGKITDIFGNSLAGAAVSAFREDGTKVTSTTSDVTGYYSLDLSDEEGTHFTISASCDGYSNESGSVIVIRNTVVRNFMLYSRYDGDPVEISKHGEQGGSTGWGSNVSIMGAVKYSADELKDYVGSPISTVDFMIDGPSAESVYVIVEFGKERVLTQIVDNPTFGSWTQVEVASNGIVIPEGKDVYVGYAIVAPKSANALITDGGPWVEGGGYSGRYVTEGSTWQALRNKGNLMIHMNLLNGNKLRAAGFSFIKYTSSTEYEVIPGRGLSIEKVKWTNNGSSLIADVTYKDGSKERIEMEL